MSRSLSRMSALAAGGLLSALPLLAADVALRNNAGVEVVVADTEQGYALDRIALNGEPVEAPLSRGMIRFLDTEAGHDEWFHASRLRRIGDTGAVFSGEGRLGEATLVFEVTLEVPPDVKAVRVVYDFAVDRDVVGRVAALQYHREFAHTWKGHIYPWAADAKYVHQDPLTWVGIPSLFLYRDDRSLGALWGIDPRSDYLNPTTWTRDFGLYFTDGVTAPQYRVGGDGLQEGVEYHCPMQVVLTDERDPDAMITDLVRQWIELNDFRVEPLPDFNSLGTVYMSEQSLDMLLQVIERSQDER